MKSIEILIVEDSPGDAFLMSQVVEEYPASITIHMADDGEKALALLMRPDFKPDLILLDLNLPKISGDDVLARYQIRDAPIVVFTSFRSDASQRLAMQLGASEVVAKPSNLSDYVSTVRGVLQRWLPEPNTKKKMARG
ncbi:MAG TPA: response regulator [Bryobacteraceae bacterium]|jgi:DNA-binding response OmpR family regulator|nr:response regulator [Bryobacteraceae bacterium]